jgi:hypothetical protein
MTGRADNLAHENHEWYCSSPVKSSIVTLLVTWPVTFLWQAPGTGRGQYPWLTDTLCPLPLFAGDLDAGSVWLLKPPIVALPSIS